MARKNTGRKENGLGSIRKKITKKNGKTYTSWEGRVTIGYDENGKQLSKSVSGKTQSEVAEKVRGLLAELHTGNLVSPNSITVSEWMTKWSKECLNHVATGTAHEYHKKSETYIIPGLGQTKLQKLTPMQVQTFVNMLSRSKADGGKGLSAKYVHDIFGVLHKALETAVCMKLISANPASGCSMPRIDSAPRKQYDISDLRKFLEAIKNHIHENYYLVLLITGMREAEALGLTWDNVDFENRTIHINQQLQRNRDTGVYELVPPKMQEIRDLSMGDYLYSVLQSQLAEDQRKEEICANTWQGKNLVFPNPTGGFLSYRTVYDCYKRIVQKIGLPDMRVHDLRHAFAMLSLRNGDDVKTIQELLGHKTPEFTLRVYAYSPASLKSKSAGRMDKAIQELRGE